MDKQEAIDFILKELEKNRSQTDIVTDLSVKLNAPREIVAKFVAQIAASQQALPEPTVPGTPPPTSQAFISNPSDMPAASDAVAQAFLQGNTQDNSEQAQKAPPIPAEEDHKLETMILNALGKSMRHSDVVMMVCEETDLNWNQAQRIVARVESKNRSKLTAKQNRILLPLIIAAIVFGVLLTASGVFEYYQSYRGFTDTAQIPDRFILREGAWAISIGIVMLLGGIAGLIMSLQKLFE